MEISGNFNKAEEEERLRALLRDDFIDDLSSGGFVPVQLPMVDTGEGCCQSSNVPFERAILKVGCVEYTLETI